jgi:hypothetical protein
MASSLNYLVNKPSADGTHHVLYVAALTDIDTTTNGTTVIGFATFVELVMGSNFSLKPWQLTLLKQLEESIK